MFCVLFIFSEVMKGRQAVRNVTTGASKMVSHRKQVSDGLDNIRAAVVKLEQEGSGATKNENEFKSDDDLDDGIEPIKSECIESFHIVIKSWNESLILDYKCYSGLMAVIRSLELLQKLNVKMLISNSTSDKIQVCCSYRFFLTAYRFFRFVIAYVYL